MLEMRLTIPTILKSLLFMQAGGLQESRNSLRNRIIESRRSAQPLTPDLYHELLKLEESLPIEPYREIISASAPPPRAATEVPSAASQNAEDKDAVLPRYTNTGMQFTSKPYKYALVGASLAFGGGYLYIPVRELRPPTMM